MEAKRLLDPRFKYRNSAQTDVLETLKRFGFKPTTDEERKAAQERLHGTASVTPITRKRKP